MEPGSPMFCPNGSPWGEDRHYSDPATIQWHGCVLVAATCKQCGEPLVPTAGQGWTRYLIIEEEF